MQMEGKCVFITGGANGIGRTIVKTFAEKGAKVAFCDIDEVSGKAFVKELGGDIRFYHTDVSDAEALEGVMKNLFSLWGDIDIIINNVGISVFAPLTEISLEDFDRIVVTNLRSVFITSRMLATYRNSKKGRERYGRIINIASSRYLQSEAGSEGYAASKGGVVSLTHALAVSFGEYNITVNCISPGWIQTRSYGRLTPADHRQHPSGRVGKPEDIANTCLFLCAEGNDFINGENIVVDGGMTKRMIYK